MTPETFLEQFETFAEAPGGVAKLREMILQLAVQGKLGTQDAGDEPASVLLNEVRESRIKYLEELESAKLKVKGGIPESKTSTRRIKIIEPLPSDHDFKTPTGWKWVRVKEVGEVQLGRQRAPKYQNGPNIRPYLRVQNVYENRIDVSDLNYMNFSPLEFVSFQLRDGDILLNEGQSFKLVGRPAIYRNEVPGACFQNTLIRFRPYVPISADFSLLVFRGYMHSGKFQSVAQQTTNIAHLSAGRFAELEFPLPPLAEQKRIVAKVDQLLGLCDELAGRQESRRVARQKLVRATLDRLTSPRPGESPAPHVQRLQDHFDQLFDTPATLPALRQTILQLAVQGQLVPQDPNDEPADVLLANVESERARRALAKEIPNQRPISRMTDAECLYELPIGWVWARFGDLCLYIEAGWSPKCVERPRTGDEWGIIKISAVTWGVFNSNENKTLPSHLEPRTECEIRDGDFLMTRANTAELVAKSVVVDTTPPRLLLNDKTLRVDFPASVDRHYVNLFNNSSFARQHYVRVASGTSESMRNVSRENVLEMPVPVPPLAEQKRIVAKVTELLSLCDALESQLTQAHSASTQLLSATVAQLLGGK